MRFLAFAMTGLLVLPGLALFSVRPAYAADDVMVLNLEDSTGQARQMICRPAQPGEVKPVTGKTVRSSATPAKTSGTSVRTAKPVPRPAQGSSAPLPGSPAVARPVTPGAVTPMSPAGAVPVEVREIQSGGMIRNCPPPPAPSQLPAWQLYADPATVAAAWQCYAPRQMATSPRPWIGPDPAVHSPLPPLQKVSTPRPARRSAPARPAQAAAPASGPSTTTGMSSAAPATAMPAMPAPTITPVNNNPGAMTPAPGALPSATRNNDATTPPMNTQASVQASTQTGSRSISPTGGQTTGANMGGATGASGVYSGSAPSVP